MGLGGFIVSARTGAEFIIEPGTSLEETLAALDGHIDADTLKSLSRSTGLAKSRRAEESWPLVTKHRDLADKVIELLPDSDDARATLDRAEAALAEYFRLQHTGD